MATFNRRNMLIISAAAASTALISSPSKLLAQDFAPAGSSGGKKMESDARFVKPAQFFEQLAEQKIRCKLCPRECEVAESERGFCSARENRKGKYYTLVHSRPCAVHVDPIEKKPLFHFLPATRAFSIATAGCNMECKFCQNWNISQFRPEDIDSTYLPPENIARMAAASGASAIAYTYTEPVIFYEYMYDCARAGHELGVRSVMISNGYIQADPLARLVEVLDGVKIDLKSFTEKFYHEQCNGRLTPVLDSLLLLRQAGKWFEIVVLVIPTLNDDPKDIRTMARWIKNFLGPDVPLHLTRFHNNYKIRNLYPTPVATLERLREICIAEGLHYVYSGNVPGHPGENTYCPGCGTTLIERYAFLVRNNRIAGGKCPQCSREIAGVWS